MTSLLAEIRAKRAETRLKIIQIDADLRSEDAKEIGEIRAKTSELQQRKVSAEDQLRRIDIKAPIGGLVHALAIHTVGAVVTSGETVMLIVPEDETLTVEARLQPTDIDQIHLGQHVVVRFSRPRRANDAGSQWDRLARVTRPRSGRQDGGKLLRDPGRAQPAGDRSPGR